MLCPDVYCSGLKELSEFLGVEVQESSELIGFRFDAALLDRMLPQSRAGIYTAEMQAILTPESVTPGLLFLVSEDASTGIVLGAGAWCFAVAK